MIEKKIYIACDGKEFYSKSECLSYEDGIFCSREPLTHIYFFKGQFNLNTSISEYLDNFQFASGKPVYEQATSKSHFFDLFHFSNIIYIENEEAVNFLKETLEDTDYNTFGLEVGVNIWSDSEWKNMKKEIDYFSSMVNYLKEVNEFFSHLSNFEPVLN